MRQRRFELSACAAFVLESAAFLSPALGEARQQPPIIVPQTLDVVFGTTVSNGQTFHTAVTVVDVDSGVLVLAAGTLPPSIVAFEIDPPNGLNSPAVFNVSGIAAYRPYGTTVVIPLVATNSRGVSGIGMLTLTLIPEPTTLAALAGVGALGATRRRR